MERSETRRKKRLKDRVKNRVSTVPWKFLLLQLVLPTSDIVTDILTGYSYHKQGDKSIDTLDLKQLFGFIFELSALGACTYDVCSGRGEGGTPKADVEREVA